MREAEHEEEKLPKLDELETPEILNIDNSATSCSSAGLIQSSAEQEILSLLNPAAMLFHSGSDDRRYDPLSGEVLPQYRVSHREYSPANSKKKS